MSNIDNFNTTVAQIFSLLYERFPSRIDLDGYEHLGYEYNPINDLVGDDNPSKTQKESEEVQFVIDTVAWLIESGFIYGAVDTQAKGYANNPRKCINLTLSPKGLELLKVVPSSVNKSESLGEALRETMRKGAKDAGGKLISEALSNFSSISQLVSLLSSAG